MAEMMKTCPICGKEWEILDADAWAYKLKPSNSPTIYFCRYNCKRQWEIEHLKPAKKLIIEEEPTRRTAKQRRPPMSSRDLIEKVLGVREEGESGVEVLEQMGYEHWKKWHRLKTWAENHDPELRKRMPDTLADKRKKEEQAPPPAEEPEQKQEDKGWSRWLTPEEEIPPETNMVGGTRPEGQSDFEKYIEKAAKDEEARSEAVMRMIQAWDESHKEPEPGTPVTFPRSRPPRPSMEVIAVRTEMGEFSTTDGLNINWHFGGGPLDGTPMMQASMTRKEWEEFTDRIVPAVLDTLGKEAGI